jgi:HK97 family phage prohead protease
MSAKSGSGRIYDFTISTGSVDRMGDTVAVDGWKLDQYKRNPVVLWAHDSASLPVGRAIAVFRDGERLRATMKFADTSFADRVRQQVDDGVVKATSVGFVPINFKFAHEKARGGGAIDFTEQELLEFSIVPIPANADALLNGPAKSLDAKRRARALELLNLQLPPPMSRAEAARAARAADLARIIARPAKDAAARRRELELAEIRSRDPSCTNWWLR